MDSTRSVDESRRSSFCGGWLIVGSGNRQGFRCRAVGCRKPARLPLPNASRFPSGFNLAPGRPSGARILTHPSSNPQRLPSACGVVWKPPTMGGFRGRSANGQSVWQASVRSIAGVLFYAKHSGSSTHRRPAGHHPPYGPGVNRGPGRRAPDRHGVRPSGTRLGPRSGREVDPDQRPRRSTDVDFGSQSSGGRGFFLRSLARRPSAEPSLLAGAIDSGHVVRAPTFGVSAVARFGPAPNHGRRRRNRFPRCWNRSTVSWLRRYC